MKRIFFIIVILLMLSLSCGVASDLTDAPEIDRIATAVAATVEGVTELPPSVSTATEPPPPPEILGEPTGLRITYIRDGAIWLWEEGIGARQLTDTGMASSVKISDDGKIIAFSQQLELWSVPADGGETVQLANQAYLASIPRDGEFEGTPHLDTYEFIPGTHSLFFDIFMDTDSYPFPYGGLHRVDADGPAPTQILLDGQSGVRYYSPDRQWVALSQPAHIAVMRADGSDYRVAFDFSPILTYSEWSFQPEVVWKSDSEGFYLALPSTDILGNPNDPGRFWYVGLDGRSAQLAIFQAAPIWVDTPQVSPDGIKVLYVKEVGEGREIRIVDASTADTLFIASADANLGLVGWADNDHFGFWYGDIDKPWYASVSEHSQQDLTGVYPTLNYSIRWLADGRVVFKSEKELRLKTPGDPGPATLIDAPLTFLDFDVAE